MMSIDLPISSSGMKCRQCLHCREIMITCATGFSNIAGAVRAEAVAGAFPKKKKKQDFWDFWSRFQDISSNPKKKKNLKTCSVFGVPNIHQLWFIHQMHWFIHKHFGFDHQIKMSDPSADWHLAISRSQKNMELLSSNLTYLTQLQNITNITMFIW